MTPLLAVAPAVVEAVGSAAAVVTTLCWVPQVLRIARTRDARAVSLWSQGALAFGTLLWMIYGLMIASLPLVVANGLTMALSLTIVGLKLRYDRAAARAG